MIITNPDLSFNNERVLMVEIDDPTNYVLRVITIAGDGGLAIYKPSKPADKVMFGDLYLYDDEVPLESSI